ncbi:hypothetical protein BLNAU_1616 [Blattamonas nauphoetae]|uniref:Uncharacterized protein n=1 Tax=Blattamonas nauphoetae TaxID=2049346 RepID=A0ABQ9YIH9_9EUKA|nr:hypothetical protein BLNAU_1616 [Blattamonas nauphoetae]
MKKEKDLRSELRPTIRTHAERTFITKLTQCTAGESGEDNEKKGGIDACREQHKQCETRCHPLLTAEQQCSETCHTTFLQCTSVCGTDKNDKTGAGKKACLIQCRADRSDCRSMCSNSEKEEENGLCGECDADKLASHIATMNVTFLTKRVGAGVRRGEMFQRWTIQDDVKRTWHFFVSSTLYAARANAELDHCVSLCEHSKRSVRHGFGM